MKIWKYIFGALGVILVLMTLVLSELPDSKLHIVACDIGQGDALLFTLGSTQILTDGGPGAKIMECLGRHMPFWDRRIELVILTQPDSDHSTGLIEVFKNYEVGSFVTNSVDSGTETYRVLKNLVGSSGAKIIFPEAGQSIRVGMIYLDILSPTQDMYSVLGMSSDPDFMSRYDLEKNTNLYSIVYKLSYGEFDGLFTADIPDEASDAVANNYQGDSVEYIKVPHHGSKNGMTENLLKAFEPKLAVISSGKNNSYGHPHKEVLDLLEKYDSIILRTDMLGDVEVLTDGKGLEVLD